MLSPKTISVLRIVEYSTISMLDYFEDTLANVGLSEAWLGCVYNCVTGIRNNYVKCESNWIEKQLSLIKSEKQLSLIYLKKIESNQGWNRESKCFENGDKQNFHLPMKGLVIAYQMQQWVVSKRGDVIVAIVVAVEIPGL